MTTLHIGLLLFPKVTQLDLTGPLQVFSRIPGATVHLVAKNLGAVASDTVLSLPPTVDFAACPQLDVICVPGGVGTDDVVNDTETLTFLRRQADGARYLTSVCTGSLVLGAAGLLRGYRATTHWSAIDHLAAFGAIPERDRVCIDRNRITGGDTAPEEVLKLLQQRMQSARHSRGEAIARAAARLEAETETAA